MVFWLDMTHNTIFSRWMRHDIGNGLKLWPFLLAALLAFAWVQPHHYYPWPAFQTNAFVAGWVLGVMTILFVVGVRPTQWSPLAFAALLMCLGVVLQGQLGLITHGADTAVTALHLLACACIVVFVRAFNQRFGLQTLGDIVFSAFVIAGILSVVGAMYQAFRIAPQDQLAGLGIWIMTIPDGVRAAGNVAQPNEMATLLVWSVLGGLWAIYRRAIRWPVFALLVGYLSIGLGISQSRVGVIEMLALAAILALRKSYFGGWAVVTCVVGAMVVQVLIIICIPLMTELLHLNYDGRSIVSLVDGTARLDIYQHVLFAISQRPWLGYGMTTLAPAQWLASDTLGGLHSYFHASHNVFLDILAWWGVPIGLGIIGFLSWWLITVTRSITSVAQLVFACALVVFLIHTMVELPHWSAAYLFPAVVFAAVLDAGIEWKRSLKARSRVHALAIFFGVGIFVAVLFDYYRLEQNYNHLRAEERRLVAVAEVPHPVVLTHLADYLRMGRMIARPAVAPQTIEWMEQTVHGIPNYNTQLTHAITLALNGRKEEALLWMRRLNSVSPVTYHQDYVRVWRNFQRWHPDLIGDMEWPQLDLKEK